MQPWKRWIRSCNYAIWNENCIFDNDNKKISHWDSRDPDHSFSHAPFSWVLWVCVSHTPNPQIDRICRQQQYSQRAFEMKHRSLKLSSSSILLPAFWWRYVSLCQSRVNPTPETSNRWQKQQASLALIWPLRALGPTAHKIAMLNIGTFVSSVAFWLTAILIICTFGFTILRRPWIQSLEPWALSVGKSVAMHFSVCPGGDDTMRMRDRLDAQR